MAAKKKKYPKTVGACVDLLYERRAERLELNRSVEEMKKGETDLKDHIFNQFSKSDLAGAKGQVATASIKTTVVVQVEDWDAALAWVIKHKRWDLLYRQLSSDGVKAVWEDGKEIPGVVPFSKIDLSLTKV